MTRFEKRELHLMIVDDEQLEIDGIKATLDFHIVGISEVHEAMNIRQAKEHFSMHPVDILLCDIEMPQGNGLELLKWVKENHPNTQCVLVTCHADFEFAKQAIQYGSLDYLLKPAQAVELESALLRAIENIHETSEQLGNTQFSKLWLKHQPLILEHFWKELIRHKIHSDYEEIKRAALDMNFPGLEELKVFPILIRTQRWLRELDARAEKQLEYEIKVAARKCILKETGNGIVFDLDEGGMLLLVYGNGNETMDVDLIWHDCSKLIEYSHERMGCELCCYLGIIVHSFELVAVVERLQTADRNNVAYTNQVMTLCDGPALCAQINLPDISSWAIMLENGEKNRLLMELEQFQETLLGMNELNANVLHQLKLDFVQLMGVFLKRKAIMAHHLFSDEESVGRYTKATRSVRHLVHWMQQDIIRALEHVDQTKKSKTVVDKVKEFIAENIDKELTCEDISAQVYLNSIYLTRIFKKETGLALSEYLLQERFKLAKELLSKTCMPINQVAANVGYTNFSHFSRMFRKHTGYSPQDYRKKVCGQNAQTQ